MWEIIARGFNVDVGDCESNMLCQMGVCRDMVCAVCDNLSAS